MAYAAISINPTPSNNLVLTKPTGTVDGEILCVALQTDTNSSNAMNFAALGFTQALGSPVVVTADGMIFYVGWKVAATEPTQYTFINTNGETLSGALIRLTGMAGTLNRVIITGNNTANASPWSITTGTFAAGNTTGTTTVIYVGASDVTNPGASVVGGVPAGYTKQGGDITNTTFFNMFVATKDSVASGFSGALTGTGTAAGASAGWAGCTIAFDEAGGGGGGSILGSHFYRFVAKMLNV